MLTVRRLDISWTLIHPKAPTQNTCAHCQRSLQPEIRALTPIPTRQHFVPVSRVSYIPFRFRQHPSSSFSQPNPTSTLPQKAFHLRRPSPSPRLSVSASTGPRIIQPVLASSTPSNALLPRHRQHRSYPAQPAPPPQHPPQRRGANPNIGFRFRKPPRFKYQAEIRRTRAKPRLPS